MVSPETLVRKHLLTIKAYSSARDEYKGELGVFLDANENSFGSAAESAFNRYPDPHHKLLKERWAAIKGLAHDQVFFGNGSDEPIDLLIRLFCEPGVDGIITLPPTYGMYEVSAAINNVHNKQVPLTPAFEIDFAALKASWKPTDKILFLCTPNNPSGNLLDRSTILEIVKSFQGMVVIDEAYVDFSDQPSWTALLADYPNLIVLQTLSKAWGMAAIRVGVAMGHPWVISMMDRIKPPYNLSQPNQNWAYRALANVEKKNQYVAQILQERARLNVELGKRQSVKRIVPSDANFLLVAFDRAELLFDYLISERVIVRNRTKQLHCQDCLRITVGKPEENTRLLELIQHFETNNT